MGKESVCNAGDTGATGLIPGLERSPGGRKWQLTPVFLPGNSHGRRSLMGCSPWGCRVGHHWETKPPNLHIAQIQPQVCSPVCFALRSGPCLYFEPHWPTLKGPKRWTGNFLMSGLLGLFTLRQLFHLTYCLLSPTQHLLACEFSSENKPSLALPCLGEMPLLWSPMEPYT